MIELRGVVKRFGEVTAVSGLSLDVERGRVVGLLGHNGAGKTTLIRLIAGLLSADEGTVLVDGADPVVDGSQVRRRLGVLPTSQLLDGRLTARENLRFAGRLFGLSDDEIERRGAELLARFDLTDRVDDKVTTLSAGLRQRLALARVLLPEPEVLLLDEPSAAVDPVAARGIRDLIADLARERGTAVVVATHDLDEAGALCDEVLVLRQGKALAQGPLDRVTEELALAAVLTVRCRADQTEAVLGLVAGLDPSAEMVGLGTVRGQGMVRARVPELVRALVAADLDVLGVDVSAPTLGDLYFHLHQGEGEPGAGVNGGGPPPPPSSSPPPPPPPAPAGAGVAP